MNIPERARPARQTLTPASAVAAPTRRAALGAVLALVTALVVGVSGARPALATSVPQTYATPGTYTFTVPSGVSHLKIEAYGAQGGKGYGDVGAAGAKGGKAVLVRAVTEGQTFQVRVGGRGADAPGGDGGAGGANGGGAGGEGLSYLAGGGGGGGGASDVRGPNCGSSCGLSSRLVVGAGGGGGGGQGGPHPDDPYQQGYDGAGGGAGGGTTGARGGDAPWCTTSQADCEGGDGGGGGTQSSGGSIGVNGGGCTWASDPGTAGSLGTGGHGRACNGGGGGGGGAGLYGGGGGGAGDYFISHGFGGGGGGGGSSYAVGGQLTANVQSGAGKVVFSAFTYPESLPGVVSGSTSWSLRNSLTTGSATNGPFTYGVRPLVPISGDWDGNGVKTPGYFQGGTFYLRNANSAGAADVTFVFGEARGFPVAGDFNGDGRDDVAVFLNGTWQVRTTGSGATSSFTFGSGVWPSVVPVAGDWDGNLTDGVGFYCRDGATCPAGTWNLRQTASAGAPDLTFTYNPGTNPYPVVGDWDANGTDTVGVKAGTTWMLRNANSSGSAAITFDFGLANDLPVVWAR